MDTATSSEELNKVMNEPALVGIIDSCGWPAYKQITMSNKTEFIHCLTYHEVVSKRLIAISAFEQGLSTLGLSEALKRYSRVLRELLVHDHNKLLTAKDLLNLAVWDWGEEAEDKKIASTFFEKYLEHLEGRNCNPPPPTHTHV